jgi:hypothetical protein
VFLLRYLTLLVAFLFLLPAPALSRFSTSAEEFSASRGVAFTWSDARSRGVKIMLEYRDRDQVWRRVSLGSGFLLSSDGLFVTAYHVMKYCLATRRETSGLSVKVDCSTVRPEFRYIAENEGREFAIEVTSYLREADSTNGKEKHTPDEILKQKDFVVAKLKTTRRERFSYWRLQDFDNKRIESASPKADFSLTPLLPPKRVFIAGFPSDHNFVISEGFLNLTERYNRGYFAADLNVYTIPYLESQGVDADTKWGMRVENHMSGGAVVDSSGYVVGLIVNGNHNTAGVLSIENILSTFFSRIGASGARPAVLLGPTRTPLFLKRDSRPNNGRASLRTQIRPVSRIP